MEGLWGNWKSLKKSWEDLYFKEAKYMGASYKSEKGRGMKKKENNGAFPHMVYYQYQ